MNKIKLLSFLSIALLAINLVLIWFILSHKPIHPKGEGPKQIIIEKLVFDESQTKKYARFIKIHQTKIKYQQGQLMKLKNKLYSTLIHGKKNTEKDSLIIEINKIQNNIENIHYNHFEEIKMLCYPKQQNSFDQLCLEIAKLFSPAPPKRRK